MKKIVEAPGYKPAILVSKFKEKGIWYVRAEWTNLSYPNLYGFRNKPIQKVFPEKDCKIHRATTPFERKLTKFFKKLTLKIFKK